MTYPRTDSKYITSDMEGSTKELITGLCAALPFMQGVKLQADLARICDNSKVTDHHAILPTAEFVKTGFSSLAESEKKLMTLVCAKLLCAVAAPYEYEAVTAVFTCGGYTFTAKGRTTLCEGWREIERLSRAASGEQDEDAERGDLRTLHAAPKGIYRRYVTFGYGECGKGGHAGGRGAQRVRHHRDAGGYH